MPRLAPRRPVTDYNAIFPLPLETEMKLLSGLGIVFSLLTAAVFGVILNAAANATGLANERWQWASVGVILVCIVVFGISAFFFARQK